MLALEGLALRAFDAWEQASTLAEAVVVRPAVPILFFGDVEAYMQSPLRVITVGLNPSHLEFPEHDRFQRFRGAEGFKSKVSAGDCQRYLGALSGYFGDAPYARWFGTYEDLLDGMGASFHKGAASTALHTDLCSPVATDPTWSRLPLADRNVLLGPGRGLWHDLVRFLKPQVMLISVARAHLAHLRFESDGDWAELCRVERDNPYIVERKRMRLEDGTTMTAFFGQAAQTPFGTVSREDKLRLGARIAGELLHA
jgi:hypothetical protein